MTQTENSARFMYRQMRVCDLRPRTHRSESEAMRTPSCPVMNVDGIDCRPTRRFWNSLHARFGLSPSIYKLYDHMDVFNRIAERYKKHDIRVTIERTGGSGAQLLAVSNPENAIIRYDQLQDIMAPLGVTNLQYSNGIVTTNHTPKQNSEPFAIGPDQFCNKFSVDTPIDGYGSPATYVSLMRLVCTNGMIGYSPAFRSEINIGSRKDMPTFAIERAIQNFNSDEGFADIRARIGSAMNSWASIREARALEKVIYGLHSGNDFRTDAGKTSQYMGSDGVWRYTQSKAQKSFDAMIGNLRDFYRISNLDTLSPKKLRSLPCNCRVMDMINFASELGTHHCSDAGNRKLQAWIGETIGQEYDLEGTGTEFPEFNTFFLERYREQRTAQIEEKDAELRKAVKEVREREAQLAD